VAKGYADAHKSAYSQSYELVQLLRVNGMQIVRDGRDIILRMGHQGTWTRRRFTTRELVQQYGPGTLEYRLLRKHPRASTVKRVMQHKDLIG
jgi:hypothetical protein